MYLFSLYFLKNCDGNFKRIRLFFHSFLFFINTRYLLNIFHITSNPLLQKIKMFYYILKVNYLNYILIPTVEAQLLLKKSFFAPQNHYRFIFSLTVHTQYTTVRVGLDQARLRYGAWIYIRTLKLP